MQFISPRRWFIFVLIETAQTHKSLFHSESKKTYFSFIPSGLAFLQPSLVAPLPIACRCLTVGQICPTVHSRKWFPLIHTIVCSFLVNVLSQISVGFTQRWKGEKDREREKGGRKVGSQEAKKGEIFAMIFIVGASPESNLSHHFCLWWRTTLELISLTYPHNSTFSMGPHKLARKKQGLKCVWALHSLPLFIYSKDNMVMMHVFGDITVNDTSVCMSSITIRFASYALCHLLRRGR